eukprot:4594153-Pyramimonas_sp.AAC.1
MLATATDRPRTNLLQPRGPSQPSSWRPPHAPGPGPSPPRAASPEPAGLPPSPRPSPPRRASHWRPARPPQLACAPRPPSRLAWAAAEPASPAPPGGLA